MQGEFLKQKDVARRWGISHRTLERWRVIGHGPKFIKIGAHVAYRLRDVEDYEVKRVRTSTRDPDRDAGNHSDDKLT